MTPESEAQEDEGIEGAILRELVQVQRRIELGRKDPLDALGSHVAEQAIVENSCCVKDCREWAIGRDAVEESGDSVRIGDIARGEGGAGAEGSELGEELRGALGLGASAAGEHEVLSALASEPSGDVSAEGAGASGDEDGASGREVAGGRRIAERRADEAASVEAGRAQSELVFVVAQGEGREQAVEGAFVERSAEVDEPSPTLGMLEADDAAKAPGHGLGGMGEGVGVSNRDGAAREEPQGSIEGDVVEAWTRASERARPAGRAEWSARGLSSRARSESTPRSGAASAKALRRCSARAPRSVWTWLRRSARTRAPRRVRASVSVEVSASSPRADGTTTSQVPARSAGVAAVVRGFQVTR
jgi:hypothetical protein